MGGKCCKVKAKDARKARVSVGGSITVLCPIMGDRIGWRRRRVGDEDVM